MAARILAAALLAAAALPAAAERPIPPLTGPVVDEAGLLDQASRRRLEDLCRAAWALPPERRIQLQFLVVRSLGGEAIESLSMRALETWKIGQRGKDNGVLVTVAVEDRRVRIETGYGAEGGLTDAQAGRIIRNTIAPAFREGRYGDGLHDAAVQILSALGALPGNVRAAPRRPAPGGVPLEFIVIVLLVFFGAISSMVSAMRRGRGGGWWGGPWTGGGWGGGGWGGGGGGGWSGGGGGGGGGGASGGW